MTQGEVALPFHCVNIEMETCPNEKTFKQGTLAAIYEMYTLNNNGKIYIIGTMIASSHTDLTLSLTRNQYWLLNPRTNAIYIAQARCVLDEIMTSNQKMTDSLSSPQPSRRLRKYVRLKY